MNGICATVFTRVGLALCVIGGAGSRDTTQDLPPEILQALDGSVADLAALLSYYSVPAGIAFDSSAGQNQSMPLPTERRRLHDLDAMERLVELIRRRQPRYQARVDGGVLVIHPVERPETPRVSALLETMLPRFEVHDEPLSDAFAALVATVRHGSARRGGVVGSGIITPDREQLALVRVTVRNENRPLEVSLNDLVAQAPGAVWLLIPEEHGRFRLGFLWAGYTRVIYPVIGD